MPDKYGRVGLEDWNKIMGMVGTVSAIGQSRKRTGIMEAREARAKTEFGQTQEDRKAYDLTWNELRDKWIEAKLLEPDGETLTTEGLKGIGNPDVSKDAIKPYLREKGSSARISMQAASDFTAMLAQNAKNRHNIGMILTDNANKEEKEIRDIIKVAREHDKNNEPKLAAQKIVAAIDRSNTNTRAKVTEDNKIEIWTVVDGVKQKSTTIGIEEAFKITDNILGTKYVVQSSSMNRKRLEEPSEVIEVTDPSGNKCHVVQKQRLNGVVEYTFFDSDNKVIEDAPEDMELALQQGWKRREPLAERKFKEEKKKTVFERGIKKQKVVTDAETAAKKVVEDKEKKRIADLKASGERWSKISKEGRVKAPDLRNYNALQWKRDLPLKVEKQNELGEYIYEPDVSKYVREGDRLENQKAGKGIKYLRSLPESTFELVTEYLAERQAGEAEKKKSREAKEQEEKQSRLETEKAASARNVLSKQIGKPWAGAMERVRSR